MAKKRRDKERDSSSVGKVAKVGAAALSVGVTAASFAKMGYTRKLTSEIVPTVIGASKTINSDLRKARASRDGFNKGIKMQDIYDTYQNHLKNNNLLKNEYKKAQIQSRKNIKIKTDDKRSSIFGQVTNAYQTIYNDLNTGLKEAVKSQYELKYIQEKLVTKYKDKNEMFIKQIADNAFANIEENTIIDKNNKRGFSSFLDKHFEEGKFTNQQKNDFLESIYEEKDRIGKLLDSKEFKEKTSETKEQIAREIKKKAFESKKRKDTLFGKASNAINKAFGTNIDLEEELLGSRAMTVRDFLEFSESDTFDNASFSIPIKNNSASKNNRLEVKDLKSIIKEQANKDEDFKDVIIDKSIRITKEGEIYNTYAFDDMLSQAYRKFSSSLPGTLFGQTDRRLANEAPVMAIMKAGTRSTASAFELGNETPMLRSSKIAIGNARTGMADLYNLRLDIDGNLIMDSDALVEDVFIRNIQHGKRSRLYKNTLGTGRVVFNQNEDSLAQLLDIGQSGAPSALDKFKAKFNKGKNPDWIKNILDRVKVFTEDETNVEQRVNQAALNKAFESMTSNGEENAKLLENARAEVASRLFKDIKETSALLNNYTAMHQIDDDTIQVLLDASNNGLIKDKHSKRILEALTDDLSNMELLQRMSTNGPNDISFAQLYNKDLENIINRGLVNTDHIMHMQNISQLKYAGFLPESTNVMEVRDIIRREAIKEVMIRETAVGMTHEGEAIFNAEGIRHLEQILQSNHLTKEQSNNLRYTANWGIMQSSLKLQNDTDSVYELDRLLGADGSLNHFENLIKDNPDFKTGYRDMLNDLSSKYNIFDPGVIGNINEVYANEYNSFDISRKSSLHIDNLAKINSINDLIKTLGQAKDELLAGRHDLANYTTLTQIPQFMVSRLAWGVEEVGLGFSSKSTGSTLDVIKNIGLKRVLPIAAAFSLYDYLDYESENFTGVSMTGAAANTLSNFDIASRKLAYSTGIGQALDWFKESSVIGEYWTGSTDFQTAEEREDWYENGYQAVRGGRFWGLGSTSEYRGSAIQYYQPNYLKRAHSNWAEIGTYGSAEEKFKHSWIPSLRHPFSPIRAALDPYWLEKKNMEDRPYPLTGKLFSEGTPWGAILNPTIGEILKPVRTLPEVRKRLGNDGRDIRTVVENINERIKNKANENDDMLIVRGTDIRNASYIPYASPNDGSMNITFRDGVASAPGTGYMQDVSNLKEFIPANGLVNGEQSIPLLNDTEFGQTATEITQDIKNTSYDANLVVNEILSSINDGIKQLGAKISGYGGSSNSAYSSSNMPDLSQGTYVYQNLVNQRNVFNSNYYADNYDYKMVDKNLANNYLKDFTGSMRELSGIYNFLGELAFGEESFTFELENANAMTSFSRHFWDAQAGGIGGEFMEIARRFFASEDKTRIKYNPLRNSMEEWLPSRFLTGDPYAELPKGEMRLPGKGYESLNDLHPDMFGEYGAFDRMKILGDVAPTSEEYKIWRNIARNTITDENLVKQMDEIEQRAQKMSSKHEFYDYRYYNNNLDTKHGVVKSFEGNIVTLASGEQLRLGGITLTQDADLSQVLSVGQKIHYSSSKDAIKRLEDGIVTNAVIYKKDGAFGTNINKTLVDMGMAERDDKDKTAIGYMANASTMQQTLGMIQEMIGHANIPFLHNKYLKIETARESFRNEHIYGTSFATWDHPIKGFVNPMLNQTFGQSPLEHAAAIGSTALYFGLKQRGVKGAAKWGSAALMATANPSALLGAGIEFTTKLGMHAVGGGSNLLNVERGAKWGSVIGTIGWGLANAENPLKAATSFAIAGEALNIALDTSNVVNKAGKKVFENAHGKGALIGAGVGLAISALKNPDFDKDMFRSKWIPKETEKKYEMDEYFDRLEYIKNKGLYEQAALRAGLFEGNHNIKAIFRKLDKNKEKIAKLTRKAEKLSNKHSAGGYEYEQEMQKINNKIMALESQQMAFKGGKYTKAAIAYKKAMDSTIYGMSEGATADEILSSVPVQYKDHFKAFIDERSESERKKILKQLPEYLRKPLQIAWGEKVDKLDSNRKFFTEHKLPGMAWRGWKPNINLKHVKMKTIQNEGMLLSDFGYYDSEKSKMEYYMAPDIENFDKGTNALSYMANMTTALSGVGMTVQNISVEPTSAPGLWIVGDIKQTAKDVGKIGNYAVNSGIQTLTSLLF